jgi:hypothetical protein
MSGSKCPVTCFAVGFLLCLASAAHGQQVYYVDADAPGANNGLNWCDAWNDLQDALDVATAGDEIWVADGTYKPTGPGGPRSTTFLLVSGAAIYGGYAGCGEPEPDERDIDSYPTVLSGDLNGDDNGFINNGENSYNVVRANYTGQGTVLDGLTITGGNANYWDVYQRGGGIRLLDAELVIRSCRIAWNSAGLTGGGIGLREGSDLILADSTIAYNDSFDGGGIGFKDASSATVVNCKIVSNSASGNDGGAFTESSEVTTFTNTLIANNVAHSAGGIGGTRLNLTNCTIVDNTATGSSIGGVYCGLSTITNCAIWGNNPVGAYGSQLTVADDTTVRYSDVQGGRDQVRKIGTYTVLTWGDGNIGDAPDDGDNPLFVDPDGPDDDPGTDDDDYRIGTLSPCIDRANDFDVPADVADLDGDYDTEERTPLDLGGTARFLDDPATPDGNGVPDPPDYPEVVDMGAYEYCAGGEIIEVTSDIPSCCADARQTSQPNGDDPAGEDSVELLMSGDTDYLGPDDFTVTVIPPLEPGEGDPPTIVSTVSGPSGAITLELDGFIPAGHWTQFTHACSRTSVCIGYLPADVDGDLTSAPHDILAVIDHLNGVVLQPEFRVDADRDGYPAPADILRVIDLLNGARVYHEWLDEGLPPCPCGEGDGCSAGRLGMGFGDSSRSPDGGYDFAGEFVSALTTDAWCDGLVATEIRQVVAALTSWCVENLPREERRALAERLGDSEMRFPNPVVAEMIPRIIAALLE